MKYNSYKSFYTQDELINKGKQSLASSRVNLAIKNGRLTRKDRCEVCGQKGKTLAHHYRGYDYPYDVWFVCSKCNCRLPHNKEMTIDEAFKFVVKKWTQSGLSYFRYMGRFGIWEFTKYKGGFPPCSPEENHIICKICNTDIQDNDELVFCNLHQTKEEKFYYDDVNIDTHFICTDCYHLFLNQWIDDAKYAHGIIEA